MTYDQEVVVKPPRVSGEYRCFAIGYGKEGQLLSRDSNVLTLQLSGESDVFEPPYYTKTKVASLEERIQRLEEMLTNIPEPDETVMN